MIQTERRSHARIRALKGARIIPEGKHSSFECKVRNLSPGGARLMVETTMGLPDSFELRFDDGTIHPCKVRWRGLTEFGVSFEDQAA